MFIKIADIEPPKTLDEKTAIKKIIAVSGFMWKLTGSKIAKVIVLLIPGIAPIRVPKKTPINAKEHKKGSVKIFWSDAKNNSIIKKD